MILGEFHTPTLVGVSNSPVDQLPEIPQPYAASEMLQTFQQVESSGWGVGHF